VFKLKEVIYTALFAIVGLILLIMLIHHFIPKKTEPVMFYQAGTYITSIALDHTKVNVAVTLKDNEITSIELIDCDEIAKTMYPLLESSVSYLNDEITRTQSTDIKPNPEAVETTQLLLQGIEHALAQAKQ
jgi:uncharacterized protein with FMN-binding domain